MHHSANRGGPRSHLPALVPVILFKLMILGGLLFLLHRASTLWSIGVPVLALHGLILAGLAVLLFRRGASHGKLVGGHDPEASGKGLLMHGAATYDLLAWIATFGRERLLRERLLGLARLQPGETVLDVACGTGTLAILARDRVGAAGHVAGVDASPEMVARARAKADKAGAGIDFETAFAQQLPFADGAFDLVLGTLMLHHLPEAQRRAFFVEARRVLRPSGRIFIADFAGNPHAAMRRRRHGTIRAEEVLRLLDEAGLERIEGGPVGFKQLHYVLARPKMP